MTPEENFAALAQQMLVASEALDGGDKGAQRMFASTSLKIDGKMFTFLDRKTKRLVVKLPEKRVTTLVEQGSGERFDPGNGRLQREWFAVGLDEPTNWRDFAMEAQAYVGKRK